MKQPKCPNCGYSRSSQNHRVKCLHKPRRQRASTRRARGGWASFHSESASARRIVADGAFYDRGEVILSTSQPSEVTA